MRVEVILPKWGMTMQDATLLEWTAQPGQSVSEGETIALIETEKVEAEIAAPAAGVLTDIAVAPNETVAVGTVLAYIET